MDKAKLRRDIATAYGLLKNAVAALEHVEEGSLCPDKDSDILSDLANYQFLMDFEPHHYHVWDEACTKIQSAKCWAPDPWA